MAETTAIEWTDSTFNPWIGCTRVSPACDDCYAARSTPARAMGIAWGPGEPRRRTKTWGDPVKWNAQPFCECTACGWRGEQREAPVQDAPGESVHLCPACGKQALREARRRVFCASLADWLDNEVPIAWLLELLDLIRCTPELDWLLLSKRIGNWRKRVQAAYEVAQFPGELSEWLKKWLRGTPPTNVWLGATVIDQAEADRDVPKLLAVPARRRFLSIEPMLGPITLPTMRCDHGSLPGPGGAGGVTCPNCNGHGERDARGCLRLHWVICGGESGPRARPMHPDWARSLRDQCAAAGVAFLFKQWGEHAPDPDDDRGVRPIGITRAGELLTNNAAFNAHAGDAELMFRVGKAAAGRLLDGRTHDKFPAAVARQYGGRR